MDKMFLTFKDSNVEQKYQLEHQHEKRLSTFNFLSFGFIVAFFVKVVQSLTLQNYYALILNGLILGYLVLQVIFVRKVNKFLRVIIVIMNYVVTIYFIAFEDRQNVDNQMAMLQGVNQMAATYLLLFIGEYIDGMVAVIGLQIFRIVWCFIMAKEVQYSAITTSTLLIFYINYFNYQYNKAKRSQFLLTQVDSRWEVILNKLLLEQSYVLLQFQNENLSYSAKQIIDCDKIFSKQKGVEYFIKNSYCQKEVLQNKIYQLIKSFQNTQEESFNGNLLINFEKKQINSEISIFLGNQPTILLLFKDFFYKTKKIQSNQIFRSNSKFIKLMVKQLNIIPKYSQKIQKFQRRMIISNLLITLEKSITVETINLIKILNQILTMYSEIQFKIINQQDFLIETSKNLIYLIFFLILENSQSNMISIILQNQTEYIECQLQGIFQYEKIQKTLRHYSLSMYLVINSIQQQNQKLQINIKKEIEIPFIKDNVELNYDI